MKKDKIKYYLNIANNIALQSPDQDTKVGAILVKKDTGSIIATGYNGFARKADDDDLPSSGKEKYDYMIHSETNLIYQCAKNGISMENTVMFCTMSPCINCTRALWQCGVDTIYVNQLYKDFDANLRMKDIEINFENEGDYFRITLYIL